MTQSEIEKRAEALHRQAIVIDGHSDILIPVTEGKMDLGEWVDVPAPATWDAPPGLERDALVEFGFRPHTIYFGCMGQYDIPRWRAGGVTAQVCAVYLDDDKLDNPLHHGLEMVWNLRHATAVHPELQLCTTAADIRRAKTTGRVGAILSLEGCEALGSDVRFVDLYHQLGLRIASLTHTRRNLFADGSWAAAKTGGLTSLGRQLVARLVERRIVVDLVHVAEEGYWEVLDMVDAPVILSHSTPTMFPSTNPDELLWGKLPRPRLELPRDRGMLEALAQNGGVLGLIWFGHSDLDSVVVDIETALEVMGPDHIGLGSDFYGLELAPRGLMDISRTPALTRRLVERGHSDEMILKFLGDNYLRVFEAIWGE